MPMQLDLKAAVLNNGLAIQKRLEKKKAKAAQRHRKWEATKVAEAKLAAMEGVDLFLDGQPAISVNQAAIDHTALYIARVTKVRPEARSTHLARMFHKGVPYAQVEVWCRQHPNVGWDKDVQGKNNLGPDFKRIFEVVTAYLVDGYGETAQRFEQWKQAADLHLKMMENEQDRRIRLDTEAWAKPPKPAYAGTKDPLLQEANAKLRAARGR